MSEYFSRRQQIVISTVLTVLVIAILVALAEGAVRVRQWLQQGRAGTVEDLYVYDPALQLRVPKAGYESPRLHINARGFRGPELAEPKPEGMLRVAFLGGSTTFCAEVPDAATWPDRVVAMLRERFPGQRFDYVNGGVPGYVIASSTRNWTRRVAPLDPDVVVIYHATNDLSMDSRALAAAQGIYARDDKPETWLQAHSLLWQLAVKNLSIYFRSHGDAGEPALRFDPDALAQGFKQRLTALIRALQAQGKVVAVPTFAYRLRPDQDPDEARRAAISALYFMPFMSLDGLLAGYEGYNRAIREAAEETGAILIDGELAVPGDAAHFTDSVHFSDQGNRWMAGRVVDGLIDSPAFMARLNAP